MNILGQIPIVSLVKNEGNINGESLRQINKYAFTLNYYNQLQ